MVKLIEWIANAVVVLVILAIGGAIGLWLASVAIVWYVHNEPVDCSNVSAYGVIPKSCAGLVEQKVISEGL